MTRATSKQAEGNSSSTVRRREIGTPPIGTILRLVSVGCRRTRIGHARGASSRAGERTDQPEVDILQIKVSSVSPSQSINLSIYVLAAFAWLVCVCVSYRASAMRTEKRQEEEEAEEEEEEERLFKVNEEDPERDRATQV